MPLTPRPWIAKTAMRTLDLPPPFRLVVLREAGDAFSHACARAGELGAGTLVLVGRFDLAEFAIVLEPEERLAEARLAFYAGMVALGDALAACAPPEKPIAIGWPDTVVVDGGLVGGGRLGWPDGTRETAVPAWLVFGAMIRTEWAPKLGRHPRATALAEEGFEDADAERLAEGFARHLMVAIDRWQEDGFAPLAGEYLARLMPGNRVGTDIAPNGDLRRRLPGEPVELRELQSALRVPSWFDPATGGPLPGRPPPGCGAP